MIGLRLCVVLLLSATQLFAEEIRTVLPGNDGHHYQPLPALQNLNFAESLAQGDIDLATFALQSMWQVIQGIECGEVEIELSGIWSGNQFLKRTHHLWFNFPYELVRQDCDADGRLWQWARNSKVSLLRERGGAIDQVGRYPREADVVLLDAIPLDFRGLPFDLPGNAMSHWSAEHSAPGHVPVVKVDASNEEQLIIEFDSTRPDQKLGFSRIAYALDSLHGYRIIEYSAWRVDGDGNRIQNLAKTRTEWAEFQGLSVPSTCVLVCDDDRLRYDFQWKSVNVPPPAVVYELEGLGLSDKTMVIDWKVDPPFSEGTWGQLQKTKLANAAFRPPAPPKFSFLFLVNVLIIFLVLGCGTWMIARRIRNREANS